MEAPLFDELYRIEQQHWWFVARRRIINSLVNRYAHQTTQQPLKICELGCGTGGNLASWAEQGHDVVGMDASEKALDYARQRLGDRVKLGRLPDQVPFREESFDVILMADVLEHVQDDAASVRAALALLRTGGILVSTVPAHQWLYSPRDAQHHHFRRYSKPGLRQILTSPSTTIELLSYYNSVLFPVAAVARLWSRLAPPRPATAGSTEGDLRILPTPVNQGLTQVFAAERHLLGRMPLPPGLSLVSVVRKQARCQLPMAA